MGPHQIATQKAEETLFSLLVQIQKHLIFLFNVLHKSRNEISLNFQLAQGSQMFQISYFVARMGILCSKLEVCLPLTYPSTIYERFT